MPAHELFSTLVYSARLQGRQWPAFNRQLLRECLQLRVDDVSGQRWSALNYPGGYTSYNSVARLHQLSPTFAALERRLRRHVQRFAAALDFDLSRGALAMTDCWVNIMPRHLAHGLHLHPLSTLSGTYYVQVPKGAPGLKFEDPRLDRFMAAPPRKATARQRNRPWIVLPAQPGQLLLFESWLRHEVAANPRPAERISVSFNYHWC